MNSRISPIRCALVISLLAILATLFLRGPTERLSTAQEAKRDSSPEQFTKVAQPLVTKLCLECHSTKAKKGSLDLERFTTVEVIRKDVKPWIQTIEMLETGEMPPKDKPQPSAEERKQLILWIRGFLDGEAKANAGDPGFVPLRRLSNAEYDYTIRDLTGVDLRPTKEFPADGAGGEGFTNSAESLTDISPALLTKYLNTAKEISEHAYLLPEGFRFSPAKTRRDWTNESIARLQAFYSQFTADGRLPIKPYLLATVRHRENLLSKKMTVEQVAANEKLNAKYLGILWVTLTTKSESVPLNQIRNRWQTATEKDVDGLVAEISAWQSALWKFVPVGSYRYGNTHRQIANDPAITESQTIKLAMKPAPGQSEVVLYLAARDQNGEATNSQVIWQRPRFEAAGKPTLLLKDYAQFGPAYEIDYPALFNDSALYLATVAEVAQNPKSSVEQLAKKNGIDSTLLQRWIDLIALEVPNGKADPEKIGKTIPTIPLELLSEKTAAADQDAVKGWRSQGSVLPVIVSNASDNTLRIPGTVAPRRVVVHPTPKEFVAVTWKSPVATTIKITSKIAHVHPNCGNGVAWWLEHRRGEVASLISEGVLDLGGEAKPAERTVKIQKGDSLILAVDAKNGDHSCDLTDVNLTITESEKPNRVWDLSADVVNTIHAGNPHADKHGNDAVWSFVKGASRPTNKTSDGLIPSGSLLSQWRELAIDPSKKTEAGKLATQIQAIFSGARPTNDKEPNRLLYDKLVTVDSPLFKGVDLSKFSKSKSPKSGFGLEATLFGKDLANAQIEASSFAVKVNSITEIRLPATLFLDREFVVEGNRAGTKEDCLLQFQVTTTKPSGGNRWDGKTPVVTSPGSKAYQQLVAGHAEFRRVFPIFICLHEIVPNDEVVTLKMYHREDELLDQLLLSPEQKLRIDELWTEHRFISQQPIAENKYLPLFIGFVTQDQPKELLNYFEGQRENFRKRAEAFEEELRSATRKQLESLIGFAAKAYRRPLTSKEREDLLTLYETLRKKEVAHEEAFRSVLARVLVSPAFLFRIEQAPRGAKAGLINDWELATRLSYFLTSSAPDDELGVLAAKGQLHDPKTLESQTRRLLKDDRIRALAIEFGTQWIHVRGFDELKEKSEKHFPMFDAKLRRAIYEESILFFQDLFQQDRSVNQILTSDATYLNEQLAKHYGIPGVTGPEWRRVEGVQKHGRGGILGLASVQAKQAGASRTSPVLRGNWVVETLLGEKLPRPPANVPSLPEEEGTDKLTMRQQVEKHARLTECAVCHTRIDPFGFALEKYDPIGRRREKDLGGLTVDTHAKLKDGTEFDGLDGLRTYLMTKKKDVIVRLFCKKLLGYALGRSVTLSDQSLIDEMMTELTKNDGRLSSAVLAIVRSPQFRMIRGTDFPTND